MLHVNNTLNITLKKTVIDGHIWQSIWAQSPFGQLAPRFQGDLWAEKIV